MDKGYVQSLVEYLKTNKKKNTKLAVYETSDRMPYMVYVIDDGDASSRIAKALSLNYHGGKVYDAVGACIYNC